MPDTNQHICRWMGDEPCPDCGSTVRSTVEVKYPGKGAPFDESFTLLPLSDPDPRWGFKDWRCFICGGAGVGARPPGHGEGLCAPKPVDLKAEVEQLARAAAAMREALIWGQINCRSLTGGDERRFAAALVPDAGKDFVPLLEFEKVRAQKDGAYSERNMMAALMARMAIGLGWRAGVGEHPASDVDWEADWRTIVFIDLPNGQVSWHFHDSERPLLAGLPPYPGTWDGHDTPEKYRRANAARPDVDEGLVDLVIAREREACAKVAESGACSCPRAPCDHDEAGEGIAGAIRARKP